MKSKAEYDREYYLKNKIRINARNIEYAKAHVDEKRIADKIYSLNNKEQLKLYKAKYYLDNKLNIAQKAKEHYSKNKDVVKAKVKAWVKLNPDKVKVNKSKYYKANPEKINFHTNKRRVAKLERQPSWANEFFIQEAYHLAKLRTEMTGIVWHVDHILPLQGKLVSGFHVENNLQVIPAKLNFSKNNKFEII